MTEPDLVAAETPPMPWLELARRNQRARVSYEKLADECWRDHEYLNAIRYRGMAEGIALAQSHQVAVLAPDVVKTPTQPSKGPRRATLAERNTP